MAKLSIFLKRISEKGIYFLDCGTSGGLEGARYGACFMVGGKKEAIKIAEPILTALAVKDDTYTPANPAQVTLSS